MLLYIRQAIAVFGCDDNFEQSNNINVMHYKIFCLIHTTFQL